MKMNEHINLAIQVLPSGGKKHPYAMVDEAIKVIQNSGFKYRVCPFETVIEAPYSEAMELVKKVQEACYDAGAENMICYLKIQTHRDREVKIADKMSKYE